MTVRRKDITFFYSNPVERETTVPVAEVARSRGYAVHFSEDPFRAAEIGLYCQHDCFPKNSALSVVMLHDMGQGQLNWPNIWRAEPWDSFDAGILPGEVWAKRWQQSSGHPFARPRQGVFTLGWPKSDVMFSRGDDVLSERAELLRRQMDLQHPVSVLYAPAWEFDNKQDEFVQALIELPVNLLLKQFPWTDQWPDQVANVAAVNALHRAIAPNVHIVDPDTSIMDVIELADIIVSEESSCLLEGLLSGIPAVSVSDWMIPDTQPPRLPAAPFEFLTRTTKAGLRETVSGLLEDLPARKQEARQRRLENFANLGAAAEKIMDLVDALAMGQSLPFTPIEATQSPHRASLADYGRRYLRQGVFRLKFRLGIRQPLKKLALDLLGRQ